MSPTAPLCPAPLRRNRIRTMTCLGALLVACPLARPVRAQPPTLDGARVDGWARRTAGRYGGSLVVADLVRGTVHEHGAQLDEPHSAASTFKLLSTYALLSSRRIVPSSLVECQAYRRDGHVHRCWKRGGHGAMDVVDALSVSCNLYFHRLFDPDVYHRVVGLALGAGYVYPRGELIRPDPALLVHGDILAITPRAQLAILLGIVPGAMHPRLESRRLRLPDPDALEAIRVGMEMCVDEGSGKLCKISGFPVAGKTGSWKGTRWFLSYAPVDDPRLAVVAYTTGGTVRKAVLMSRYFYGKVLSSAAPIQPRRKGRRR